MLVNTTRSTTIVFRFLTQTLAKFLLKRHTRFAYVARIGLLLLPPRRRQYGVDLIEHWLVPFGSSSPLAGPVIAHRPCKVLGLGPRHDGEAPSLRKLQPGDGCRWAHPPMSKINPRPRSPPRAQTGKGKFILPPYFPARPSRCQES